MRLKVEALDSGRRPHVKHHILGGNDANATRRTLLSLVALTGLSPSLALAADPRLAERAIGKPDAKTQVVECFSLTCTHCAAFAQETFPDVKVKLIDTGKVYYIFHDFPLDQVALTAAMVARALPPERYEPFISALFASSGPLGLRAGRAKQHPTSCRSWPALARHEPYATFDPPTVANTAFRDAVLAQQKADGARWNI